uniref:Apomitrocomin MC4 n=1 Tax=Mitrocoma cellularia TaxID=31874 RepID=A0A0F6NWT7_MITCE|nr:apomitrocomin MC4 [Mitrocoma cellularia]
MSMGSRYAVKLDTDFDNPKWIARHKHMFNFLDINSNGQIDLNEMVHKASNIICKKLGATEEQTRRHQKCVEDFFGGAGLEYDKDTTWPEYIEGWKRLAKTELERHSKNQVTLIRLWGDALFDIIDKDGNGSVSLGEWIQYTHCAGIQQSRGQCEATFAHCDLDGDGKLDVDEMTRQHLGFWYSVDSTCEGLYGGAVPY